MKNMIISISVGFLATAGIAWSFGDSEYGAIRTDMKTAPAETPAPPSMEKNPTQTALLNITAPLENLASAQTPYQKIHALSELRRIHHHISDKEARTRIEKMAGPVLRELTSDKSLEIRMTAIEAVPSLDPRGASTLLLDLLEKEENEELLLLAGEMLGKVATREDLSRLLPMFDRQDRRTLQIAVGSAWLEVVTRVGLPIEEANLKSRILPALLEIMRSPATSINLHRMAHQLEMKLRITYGLENPQFARPVYGIAQ